MIDRKPFDLAAYVQAIQDGPCFICEMVAGRLNGNHVIYQDHVCMAFLIKYPVLYGYALVAPVQHREHVTGNFALDDYIALQRAVYRVAEAVRRTVAPERVYILSLDGLPQSANGKDTGSDTRLHDTRSCRPVPACSSLA